MNLHDAIQQARDAISEWDEHGEQDAMAGIEAVEAARDLVVALNEALPHMVDTRRLAAFAQDGFPAHLIFTLPGTWYVSAPEAVCPGYTAAEALAAAEQEAGR